MTTMAHQSACPGSFGIFRIQIPLRSAQCWALVAWAQDSGSKSFADQWRRPEKRQTSVKVRHAVISRAADARADD